MQRREYPVRVGSRLFGYPLLFVYVFVELGVSFIVSSQWVGVYDAPLPSSGSRWSRFPAFSGTIKALRLPASHPFGLLIRQPVPPLVCLFVFRLRAPDDCRPVIGPGACKPAPLTAGIIRGGENRFSQVSWQSIPWLCAAHATPAGLTAPCHDGTVSAAPSLPTLKAPAIGNIEAQSRRFTTRCVRFTTFVTERHATLAPGWWATPLPGRGRTCWTAIIGFGYVITSPSSELILAQW